MRALVDRRGVVFRVLATLFAVAHVGAGLPLPLLLFGLLMKLDGISGDPLRGGHAWMSSEAKAWTTLGLGSVVCTQSVIYGGVLLAALWTAWGGSRYGRAGVRFFAVVCSIVPVVSLILILTDTAASEWLEVLLGGVAIVVAYCLCNAAIWTAFRAT
jgi:hypothetical protein